MAEWAEKYLSYAKNFTPKTYSEKRLAFRELFKTKYQPIKNGPFKILFDPIFPLTTINKEMALKHFQVQSENRSGNASNKDRKNLISAWNWGVKYIKGFSAFNPFLTDKFSETRSPRYVPPEKDFWKIYDVASEDDQDLLMTYLHTAARRTEIFRLRWDDVDFAESQVRLWTRKREGGTMEFDWIPLTDTLFNLLLSRKQKTTSQFVFPNPETDKPYIERKRLMEGLCNRAGVRHFGFHAIRHLTASILAQAGVPAIVIQAILRHKKISTTEKYLHRLTDLRPALQLIKGKEKTVKEPSVDKGKKVELKTI
jgi:integrase